MAIKLTSFSEEGLVEFLQSHRETQLNLKINIKSPLDVSYLKIIENQFSQLTHLTEFSIIIPHHCELAEIGYNHISNAIKHLTQLTKLSIQIDGFIQDEELVLLQNSIQSLVNLKTLIFKVSPQNDISSSVGKEFIESLSFLSNLRKLSFVYKVIKKSQMNKGNIHFWNGIQRLQNLEKLALEIQEQNYGQQDLVELFSHIIDLKKLKSFSFIVLGDPKKQQNLKLDEEQRDRPTTQFIDMMISQIGQIVNLKSLEIDFHQYQEFCFNETQKLEIIKQLSNLRYLEKLKMKTIQIELVKSHLKEYADLIGGLKYLKKYYVECYHWDIQEIKLLNELGRSFLNLTNITHFELNFEYIQVYNEFISDLSISLLNMKNLSTLNLLLSKLNKYQSIQLGSCLNQLHNLISLLIHIPEYDNYEVISLLFQNLIGGLINLKQLTLKVQEGYENKHFFQFLHQLRNLETLEISDISIPSIEDLRQFNQTLRNLKQLKTLDISVKIQDLEEQASLETFEQSFSEFQFLESLSLHLHILKKSEGLTKMNILEHLKNLKKIQIIFPSLYLNIFDLSPSSMTNQYILGDVYFRSSYENPLETETMLEIVDSLSTNFNNLKNLTLDLYLNNYSSDNSKKFGMICSKFTSLSRLALEDDSWNSTISFYSKGLKKLKGLKYLKLDYRLKNKEDERQIGKMLQKLENLRKIELLCDITEENLVNLEKELSKALQHNKKILKILINPKKSRYSQRLINTISLNQDFNVKEDDLQFDVQLKQMTNDRQEERKEDDQEFPQKIDTVQMSQDLNEKEDLLQFDVQLNQMADDRQEERKEEQKSQQKIDTVQISQDLNVKEDNLQFDVQNVMAWEDRKEDDQNYPNKIEPKKLQFLPNEMKFFFIEKEENCDEHLFLINNVGHIGLQYLMDLEIKVYKTNKKYKQSITIQDLNIQFNQLNQLRYLTLDLSILSLNEEQIIFVSNNIRHLTNLRYLFISINWIDDRYSPILDELKHLKALQTLKLKTSIYENCAVSLGNSLIELNNLQICILEFASLRFLGIQGVLSILNGLKGLENMEKLLLGFNLADFFEENIEKIDIFVQDFLEKMNKLNEFEFKLRVGFKCINILSLCSSLSQPSNLEKLTIELFNNHQLNQEMLNQLIISVDQLIHLRSLNIVIYNVIDGNNDNKQLDIPKLLSNYLNRYLDKPLKIHGEDEFFTEMLIQDDKKQGGLELQQEECFSLLIYSKNILDIKLNFIEDLDEGKVIEIDCQKKELLKLLTQIERCTANKIYLNKIKIFNEKDTNDFCTFVSRIPNVSRLQLNMFISSKFIDDQTISQIANAIMQLKNLHTLCLILRTGESQNANECSEKHLLQIISILQNQKKLYQFYTFQNQHQPYQSVDKSIIKKMKKLVTYNSRADNNTII